MGHSIVVGNYVLYLIGTKLLVFMEEIFKDVIGYEDYFKISNYGNLYSKRSNRLLKQNISNTGYYTVATKIGGRNGTNKCFKIHRLVAEAFLNPPTEQQIYWASTTKYNKVLVNHKDGNKLNNHIDNLEWVTSAENTRHAIDIGLITYTTTKKDFTHGTPTQYRYGCRCEECKQAYSKVRRAKYLRTGN